LPKPAATGASLGYQQVTSAIPSVSNGLPNFPNTGGAIRLTKV